MRLLQCVNAYTAIQSMMSDDLDYQTAYALVVLKKRLLPHVEFYRKEELKLVDCYAEKDSDGKIVWIDANRFGFRDPKQVEERIVWYFTHCAEDDMKPTVSGMALALGVDRKTLYDWSRGNVRGVTHSPIVKKAMDVLSTLWEDYMQNGKKIIPHNPLSVKTRARMTVKNLYGTTFFQLFINLH